MEEARRDFIARAVADKVPAMVSRMGAKRPGWIHKEEILLIIEHIRKLLIKPKPPKK